MERMTSDGVTATSLKLTLRTWGFLNNLALFLPLKPDGTSDLADFCAILSDPWQPCVCCRADGLGGRWDSGVGAGRVPAGVPGQHETPEQLNAPGEGDLPRQQLMAVSHTKHWPLISPPGSPPFSPSPPASDCAQRSSREKSNFKLYTWYYFLSRCFN